MARKRARMVAAAAPSAADDFKVIRGIGPVVESRLHSAGILTLAQLAAMLPADVAALVAGLSANRIAKQNWIGQARKLASKRTPAKLRKAAAALQGRQHYATFTLELLLDEGNNVRRTRVVHVQDGDEDAWANWEDARLIDFVVKHAALQPQPTKPTPSHEAETGLTKESDERAMRPAEARTEELPANLRLVVGDISLEEVLAGWEVDEQGLPKRLRVKIDFQLSGQAAYLLNTQQSPYFVQVLACDLATGQTTVLAADKRQLQPFSRLAADQQGLQWYPLAYTTTVEFGLPSIGRYQLLGTVLFPDSNTVGTGLGPIFKVIP